MPLPNKYNAYRNVVDLSTAKNYICEKCQYRIVGRELQCANCGSTRFFRGGDIEEKEGKYFLRGQEIVILA